MVLLLLREAIACFLLDFKYSCIAVFPLLETLLPSDTNFAALNLYLWPVHCWKEDWHFQLCWVFPIVTAYCFHRNPSKCFNRMWVKKEFCWHIYSARFLTIWLMSPQYSLLLKKQKQKCRKHTCCFHGTFTCHFQDPWIRFSLLFFSSPPSLTLSSFCPWKPFST